MLFEKVPSKSPAALGLPRLSKALFIGLLALPLTGTFCAASVSEGPPWLEQIPNTPSIPTPDTQGSAPPVMDVDPFIGEATDPVGDTFGALTPQIDLVGISFDHVLSQNNFELTLSFNGPIAPISSGLPEGLFGYVEFDIDAEISTGFVPAYNIFCPTTGPDPLPVVIGAEKGLILFAYNPVNSTTILSDGSIFLEIPTTFGPQSVTYTFPEDSFNGYSAPEILVTVGTPMEFTDCGPEGPTPVAPAQAAVVTVPTMDHLGAALLVLLLTSAALLILRRRI